MSLKNKFLRSLLAGAIALGLTASITSPTQAADGGDVVIGLLGGLFIAGALYGTQRHRHNRSYASSNAYDYNYSQYNRRNRSEFNRYGNEGRGRNQFDHGRHNRFKHRYRY